MKDETRLWLEYANENYLSSKILLESHLYNPTLQNIQQAIEKYIKAYFIENGIKLQKTHNFGSLLPDFEPDEKICLKCLDVLERVRDDITEWIDKDYDDK